MWIDEAPRIPDDVPVIMYLAQTSVASAPKNSRLMVGVCEYMTSDSITLNPTIDAAQWKPAFFNDDVVVRILHFPKHGKLSPVESQYSVNKFYYDPSFTYDKDGYKVYYAGKDTFAFSVSGGGVTVQVHYVVGVEVGQPASFINDSGDRQSSDAWKRYCPKGETWKISRARVIDPNSANLAALERNSALSGWIAEASKTAGSPPDTGGSAA